MTPVRAFFASLIAAILLGAGAFIAASFAGGRPHDIVPLLAPGRDPFSLWCFLAAWGAAFTGALGVIAAFLAFIAPEEDDDPRFRRRGFPKAAPLVLIALSLGLVWFSVRCCGDTATPIAVPVEPAPPNDDADKLQPENTGPEIEIAPSVGETSFAWRYMDPLMRGDSLIWTGAALPFSDDVESERLLCGRAWVAVTGSASEEGPPARNSARAKERTQKAMSRAADWLTEHGECGPAIVLGVDLGQHAHIAAVADDGASTAYQRQILTVGRVRQTADERLSVEDAEAELAAFLADAASRTALYGPRRFPAEPKIITP